MESEISKSLPDYEEICSNIRSTIGKANLLMNKKGRFEQFRGLIHNCEFNLGKKILSSKICVFKSVRKWTKNGQNRPEYVKLINFDKSKEIDKKSTD